MKKVLMSINTDLGSSIALRYVEEISSRFQMTLYDVHVVEPKKAGSEPGSGWVQKTWENALVESGREAIRKFLSMEKVSLPLLRNPKILIGDRTDKLLSELHDGQYDLFLEGVPPTSNPSDFSALLNSKLYRSLPCPVLVVKNLVPLKKVALLSEENTDVHGFISCFLDMFNGTGLDVDLIDVALVKSNEPNSIENDASNPRLEKMKSILVNKEIKPNALKVIRGSAKSIEDIFREYGLVASSLKHTIRKTNPLIELLGRIASPVLICRH